MPCPPDPVERDYSLRYEDRWPLIYKIRDTQASVCRVRALIRKIRGNYIQGELPSKELENLVEAQIQATVPDCDKPFDTKHSYPGPDGWPTEEDLTKLETHLFKLSREFKEWETVLCISRDTLVKMIQQTDFALEGFEKSLRAEVEAEFKAQLNHRKEDRKQMISFLKQLQKQIVWGVKPDYIKKHPELDSEFKIGQKIQWLQGLTNEELLADRNIF